MTFDWGLDLSRSAQGAGGVGGLLAVTKAPATGTGNHFYAIADGNGNVGTYLDAAGTNVAHYEYDSFGREVVRTGEKVDDFAHRFSTQYSDQESGLLYYGYRYYDPVTGRWPSRDPLWEWGGFNLYGFGPNNPIYGYDYLGWHWTEDFLSAANFVSGVGDSLTFGLTTIIADELNKLLFDEEEAEEAKEQRESDESYGLGQIAGDVNPKGIAKGITKLGVKKICKKSAPKPELPIKPPPKGKPGETVVGKKQSRTYDENGNPKTDRDYPHGGGPKKEQQDHSHDWSSPTDRGPARDPKPGDPPAPPGFK